MNKVKILNWSIYKLVIIFNNVKINIIKNYRLNKKLKFVIQKQNK